MNASPRPGSRPAPNAGPDPSRTRRSPLLVVGVVAAIVVAALIVALVVNRGSDGEDQGSPAPSAAPSIESAPTLSGGSTATVPAAEYQAVTVTGTPLSPLTDGASDLAIGTAAPTLSGYGFDGTPMTITPGGRAKMVVFLAHWCPHCNREVPRLIQWKDEGRVPEGLEVVAVATASRSDAPNWPPSKWVQDKGWPWAVMADSENGDAAVSYGVTGFPYFAIVGTDGTVKARFSGEIELDELDKLVAAALAA